MKKLTYKEAYDKIIEAYFKDEIKPMECNFCFCGTLAGNEKWLGPLFKRVDHNYSALEYGKMEAALLSPLKKIGIERSGRGRGSWYDPTHNGFYNDERYEDLLFKGMAAALEVLKQIHKERGEDVDGVQEFTKRKLDKIISD